MEKQKIKEFDKLSKAYFYQKIKFEQEKENFEKFKIDFYKSMSNFWKSNKLKDKSFKSDNFSVTKVQTVKVEFDLDKLDKNLPDGLVKECINKELVLTNADGLIEFLKSKKITYKEVKEFFEVKRSANEKAINKLYELGHLDKKIFKDASTVNVSEPYYKINALESKEDGDSEKG